MTITKIIDMTYGRNYVVFATLAFGAGDTYAGGGVALSFAGIAKATRKPLVVWFNSANSVDYVYAPGTDAQTGKVKIFTVGGGAGSNKAELAGTPSLNAAPYNNDTITIEAHFFGEM